MGYRNGLFKKTHNSHIIDADADDIVNNTAQADPMLVDNGVETPTP